MKIETNYVKGEPLTFHEIEILENRKIQKERDYLVAADDDKNRLKTEYTSSIL